MMSREHPLTAEAQAWIDEWWPRGADRYSILLSRRALKAAVEIACLSPDPAAQIAALELLRARRLGQCATGEDELTTGVVWMRLGLLPGTPAGRRMWRAAVERRLEWARLDRRAPRIPWSGYPLLTPDGWEEVDQTT